MKPATSALSVAALALLVASPAYACGPSRGEAVLMMAVGLPVLLLLASPLLLLLFDALRLPFGARLGRGGALLRAVLGAGGATLGFWGGVAGNHHARPYLIGYGALCALVLAYGAVAARRRGA